MPKEEWGTKRVCPTTGKRFYDLNRSPVVSPYTGEVVPLDTGQKSRTLISEKPRKQAEDQEDAVVLEEESGDNEVDLGDDVLEDDNEEENVSLDDLADVASDEEES